MNKEELIVLFRGLPVGSEIKINFTKGDLSDALDVLISCVEIGMLGKRGHTPYNLKVIFTQSRGPNPINPFIQRYWHNQVDLITERDISAEDAIMLSVIAPYCTMVTVIPAKDE